MIFLFRFWFFDVRMNAKLLGIATQIMVMAIIISVVLLFAGIGVLVVIHVCLVGRAFTRGFNHGTVVLDRIGSEHNSMSQKDIEKLPSYVYKEIDSRTNNDAVNPSPNPRIVDCAVCLESFKVGDKCRLLPTCKHSFHAVCVDAWLVKSSVCPICRGSAKAGEIGLVGNEKGSGFDHGDREVGNSVIVESQTPETNRADDRRVELRDFHSIESGPQIPLPMLVAIRH